MKSIVILVFTCAFLSFEKSFTTALPDVSMKIDEPQKSQETEKTPESAKKSLHSGESGEPDETEEFDDSIEWTVSEYELTPVKNVTEVSGTGKIPYLEKHPKADTDKLEEDVRKKMCRAAFDLVKESEYGKEFEYLEGVSIGKVKAYVLVDSISEDTSDLVEVVPACKCPSNPPTYIHVNMDGGDDEEPLYQVIFEVGRPYPTFKELMVYQWKTVEDIFEADIEKITSVPPSSIESSLYDTDRFEEAQRLRICRRALLAAPEMDIELLDTEETGMSKYYAIVTRSRRKTEHPKHFEVIMQTYDCNTSPKIYIHINGQEKGHNLWAIIKEKDVKQLPTHDIMGYEILPVLSIEVYKGSLDESDASQAIFEVTGDSETVEDSNAVDNSKVVENLRAGEDATSAARDDSKNIGSGGKAKVLVEQLEKEKIKLKEKLEQLEINENDTSLEQVRKEEIKKLEAEKLETEKLKQLNLKDEDISRVRRELRVFGIDITKKSKIVEDSRINTDDLSPEQRNGMCKTAIKAVSGLNVELTDGEAGKSEFYRIEVENLWSQEPNIVKAFPCPSQPKVWLHVSRRESIENTVWVIVQGAEDLTFFTKQFKK